MHDEASPSFVDMLDQTTLGHRWLLQEFNFTPTTTWQIGAPREGVANGVAAAVWTVCAPLTPHKPS